jgi:hypothetical protein
MKTFDEAIKHVHDTLTGPELLELMDIVQDSKSTEGLVTSLLLVALTDPTTALTKGIAIGTLIGKEMYLDLPKNLGVKADA